MFDVKFSVVDSAGRVVSSTTEVFVDAAMPSHGHGMNTRPRVQRNADGTHTARGLLFHMAGHWELYFDITAGDVTERAQFGLELE